MQVTAIPKWAAGAGVLLVAAIAVASVIPADFQVRLGLHWLVEHFLVYFFVTLVLCIAWPRPALVASVLMMLAGVFEALQGLTTDRTPDLLTAISGAAGVISGALLAQLVIWSRKRHVSA